MTAKREMRSRCPYGQQCDGRGTGGDEMKKRKAAAAGGDGDEMLVGLLER